MTPFCYYEAPTPSSLRGTYPFVIVRHLPLRHCEAQSAEAIWREEAIMRLLRFARNDTKELLGLAPNLKARLGEKPNILHTLKRHLSI